MFFKKQHTFFLLLISLNILGMESPSSLERKQEITQEQKNHVLVPDDINTPTRWIKHDVKNSNIPKEIFTNKLRIRAHDEYMQPRNNNNIPELKWIVIHGTLGTDTSDYFNDDPNPGKSQNYRHIKYNASSYSTIKEKKLDLFSYLWTGENNHKARKDAALVLLNFLQWLEHAERVEITIVSHSHGCNVANILSNLISPERPIHMLIHFGCPVREVEQETEEQKKEIELYLPKHCIIVCHFYSDDWIASLGKNKGETPGIISNLTVNGIGGAIVGELASYGIQAAVAAVCPLAAGATLAVNGYHKLSKLYFAVKYGWRIFRVGSAAVGGVTAAGISLTQQMSQGNGEFPVQNGKIILNIRTKIDGTRPWHTSQAKDIPVVNWFTDGNSITDAVQYLIPIIQKIQNHYTHGFAKSYSFNLNIDRTNKENPLMLVIKEQNNATPPETVELIRNNQRSILHPNQMNVEASKQIEAQNSAYNAKRYTDKYGGKIEDN